MTYAPDFHWYAIYTRYNCEKTIVESLKKQGIDAYTPLLKKTKKYTRKLKTHFYPLLKNYAFVYISKSDRIKVLNTKHVLGFVQIGSEIPKVKEKDILWLKRIVGESQDISIWEGSFQMEQAVEIIAGSLTGLTGLLIDVKNKSEMIVSLDSIDFQLKMSVHPSQLRLLPSKVA